MPARYRLIVNADDFGFTRDVNAGIVEAHRKGILTATTLMANGDAFEDAVALARETPSLDVGCHLVLVQGRSVADPSRPLPRTIRELIVALIRREIPLYKEASAQLNKLVNAGIRPTHIDSHKHTHLLPPVLDVMAKLAQEFQIPWIRRRFVTPRIGSKLRGINTTDRFVGFRLTGRLDTERLVRALERLPSGLTEFMCHPGQLGPELQAAATRLKSSRQIELAALLSPDVRKTIERRGIELINYRQA
jgi:predicted glycoside hydrolase/deacetylase ChbG (UPF0249 family)